MRASRALTMAENLAATRLSIEPEQPPEGAHLVYESSAFPEDLISSKEVVTSSTYCSLSTSVDKY